MHFFFSTWERGGRGLPWRADTRKSQRTHLGRSLGPRATVRATFHTLRKENHVSVCGGRYEVQNEKTPNELLLELKRKG